MSSASKSIFSYVIICRHGHRAPASAIYNPAIASVDKYHDFENLWKENVFPFRDIPPLMTIESNPNNPQPPDALKYPYGCLTKKGASHMFSMGSKISQIYPEIRETLINYPQDFVAYSTNFHRTQVNKSAFSILPILTNVNTNVIS
jgi:hypothetical protein